MLHHHLCQSTTGHRRLWLRTTATGQYMWIASRNYCTKYASWKLPSMAGHGKCLRCPQCVRFFHVSRGCLKALDIHEKPVLQQIFSVRHPHYLPFSFMKLPCCCSRRLGILLLSKNENHYQNDENHTFWNSAALRGASVADLFLIVEVMK